MGLIGLGASMTEVEKLLHADADPLAHEFLGVGAEAPGAFVGVHAEDPVDERAYWSGLPGGQGLLAGDLAARLGRPRATGCRGLPTAS